MKSERGSPSHSSSNESSSNTHSASSPVAPPQSTGGGAGGSLLATQTGATSISITKQPPAQLTTTNVIIKPPIIKDIGSHLSSGSSSAISSGGGNSSATCNGTTNLVVSVPLSPVNLGSSSGGGSSTSQNLFQQAIQNRSEHLNFSSAGRSGQQSSGHAALSRSSPIITGMGGGDHHHSGMHHRQSPLIQSSLGLDNGGRSSISPQIGGNAVHQSDSGMLKVTYEKQAHGSTSRLSALQDDMLSSSRRSR